MCGWASLWQNVFSELLRRPPHFFDANLEFQEPLVCVRW